MCIGTQPLYCTGQTREVWSSSGGRRLPWFPYTRSPGVAARRQRKRRERRLVLWRQYRNASGVEHTTTQYRHRTEARVQLPITLAVVASVAPAAPSPNGSGGGGGSVVVEGRDQAPVREMSIPMPRTRLKLHFTGRWKSGSDC
jgi:hypothetical protein